MIRRRPAALFLLGLTAVATACAKMPPTHYYVLRAEVEGKAAAPGLSSQGSRVGVRSFQVDAPFDQDRIAYRVSESSPEVEFYAYHRWAAPPSRMLPQLVADALQGTPGVEQIEPVQAGRDYAAYLDGRVVEIGEIDRPDGQLVRVKLELRLTSAGGDEVWSKSVSAQGLTQADEVAGVVEKMSQLLVEALRVEREALGEVVRTAVGR